MLTSMYTIYDQKAKVYNRPFHLLNDDVAMRTAQDLAADKNTDLGRHPEDFILFKIAHYDDSTATIALLEKPELFCKFHEITKGS